MITSISVWRVLGVMVVTSLLLVNSEVNLLPSWTFGRNRVGNHREGARRRGVYLFFTFTLFLSRQHCDLNC